MKEIGERLKEARESMGISIDEVAQDLKIRPSQIEKMEQEHTRLLNEIAYEESQCVNITIPQVKFFLTQLRKGNINDIKYKKLLINVLIYQIYLYDDEITIIFNTQNKPITKNIPRINELESSFMGKDALP